MTITTICENRSPRAGLLGEHGLAVLLEAGGRRILFDTGAGATLQGNAGALGLDLGSIDAVFLSHGHYDHTGGLEQVLTMRGAAAVPVYGHPAIFGEKYISSGGQESRYIGMPRRRAELEALGAVFHLSRDPLTLGPGIRSTGEIPRNGGKEAPGPLFLLKEGGRLVEDPLHDDQALFVESSAGVIVLLGCAHAGLVETLDHILTLIGADRLHAVLGGTHLLHTPEERLTAVLTDLKRFDMGMIAPCHCTGLGASCALRRAYGKRYLEQQVGTIFQFPS